MLFVANWKMFFTTSQALDFFIHNNKSYASLVQQGAQIVICPSFPALASLKKIAAPAGVGLGAQNCVANSPGAFTGAVSIEDLVDVGCSYCLVGHSEQRLYCGETDEGVASKTVALLKQGVTPIVCLGESKQEREQGLTQQVVCQQLMQVLKALPDLLVVLYIAYEPIWAIGTGSVPTMNEIEEVLGWLDACVHVYKQGLTVKFLYGGSVSAKNSAEISKISHLSGFLIGKASLDFQEFEKIVHCSFQ